MGVIIFLSTHELTPSIPLRSEGEEFGGKFLLSAKTAKYIIVNRITFVCFLCDLCGKARLSK